MRRPALIVSQAALVVVLLAGGLAGCGKAPKPTAADSGGQPVSAAPLAAKAAADRQQA